MNKELESIFKEIGCKKIYRDRKAVKIYVEFYSFLYIIKVTETI